MICRSTGKIEQESKEKGINQSLKELKVRFERWRVKRGKRGRIPEELWEGAVKEAQQYSVGVVSRLLGLDYQELKRRVQVDGVAQVKGDDFASKFIELNIGKLSREGVECEVELEGINGTKMRMHLKNTSDFTPLELAKVFFGRHQ